ncbi:MAG: PTS lactose/cellobiose transporter subunit IIA [Lachnospiraceae bacterium]|nr:PTS lactose/cellobiose transporter subunit IIA [Lachnospiraceae bacterium]
MAEMEDMEATVVELVVEAGNARSCAIEAIRQARDGNFREADRLMAECDQALIEAHRSQASAIQAEINGEKNMVTLLMVHAQDHIMNAITVQDLAKEMIEILKKEETR